MSSYDDEAGWVAVPGLLTEIEADDLVERCRQRLADLGPDRRVGDKPAAGTRRLVDLADRIPEAARLTTDPRLVAEVEAILGPGAVAYGITYRAPEPGFGGQRLHADAIARSEADAPATCATSIVALTAFTAENGATGVVPGSHRRPDLQRHSGTLEHHPDERPLTGPAGTAFVFDGHLLHRGRRNDSSEPRPAIQITWSLR